MPGDLVRDIDHRAFHHRAVVFDRGQRLEKRANTHTIADNGEYFVSEVTPVPPEADPKPEVEALRRAVTQHFDQYVKLNKKIPPEILTSIAGIDDAGRLADTIAAHLPLKLEAKQSVLDLFSVAKRLEKLLELLEHEVDILQVEKRIRGRVKRQMEKSQREYYLNEQVKAIQKELGDGEEGADLEELEKKIAAAKAMRKTIVVAIIVSFRDGHVTLAISVLTSRMNCPGLTLAILNQLSSADPIHPNGGSRRLRWLHSARNP